MGRREGERDRKRKGNNEVGEEGRCRREGGKEKRCGRGRGIRRVKRMAR